jgi:PKD repeat protein
MKLNITFFLLLIAQEALAQNFCGFDALHSLHRTGESAFNNRVLERLTGNIERTGETLTVPVVVHIIHNNGPENIEDDLVIDAIEFLNDAFSNNGYYQSELGVQTGIQFCLAAEDPEGDFSSGIERVESELTDVLVPAQEAELKSLSHWDAMQYLNIWVVEGITREEDNDALVGFATFPTMHGDALDGIVVESTAMGVSPSANAVVAHEVGHYLGLYHTFQGGCPNDDCFTSGDLVCDTPPDASAFNTLCFDGTNSCSTDEDDASVNNPFRSVALGGLGDQLDMQTNFMDYANLACFERFTEGQANRMQAVLLEVRTSLLQGDRCTGPCDLPIEVNIASTSLELEVGGTVAFTNASTNAVGYEWFVNGASQATTADFTFVPEEQGSYAVSVIVDGQAPGCTETAIFDVVVSCPVEASFTSSSLQFDTGGALEVENTSTGATAYTWYVDGQPVSEEENPLFEFEASGAYTLQLLAEGPTCLDWSEPLNLSVGTCASGNEANQWLFFNSFGSAYGLDFNVDPPAPVLENNLPPNADHCKTTLCDASGDVLFLCTGTEVLNRNFEVMPNGGELLGNTSSHYGSMIVQRPGDPDAYFVFHSSLPENAEEGGLYYSLIDETLEEGLGDVTLKNQFLGTYGQEALTCVRHCNLVDFWLLTYDQLEGRYLAWLVTQEGIASDPVISELSQDVFHTLPLTPTAKGDRVMHGNYLMDFDASSGALSLAIDFGLSDVVGWEFSGSGQYLYLFMGEFGTSIYQVDLNDVDESDPMAGASLINQPNGVVYFYPQRAPDGNIYIENAFGGDIARIVAPNLPAGQAEFEPVFTNFQALINSFGNYFHRYVHGESLFVEGATTVCAGSPQPYSLYGSQCLEGVVEWSVAGSGFTEVANGEILIDFPASGTVSITATMALACGVVSGTMEVEVAPDPDLDLGADFGLCNDGETSLLDAGPGFLTYTWSTGEDTQILEVSAPGLYAVTAETAICAATDEVEVLTTEVIPIDLGPDIELCNGEIAVLDAGIGYNDYVWNDGTTGPFYTAYEAGMYIVSTSVPCPSSDTLVVMGCGEGIGLSIEELSEDQIHIFPNPNRGAFAVAWSEGLNLDHWFIYAASGQRVASGQITGVGEVAIDLDLAQGLYLVELEGAVGRFWKRVVIE